MKKLNAKIVTTLLVCIISQFYTQSKFKILSTSCDDSVTAPELYHERYNNDSIIYLQVPRIDSNSNSTENLSYDSCYLKLQLNQNFEDELGRTYPYSIFNGKVSDGAYSLRRLTHHYKGFLITIRAKSKSYSQSIGYLVDGSLDTNGIKAYCGNDSCFVEKWYDQSGWGRDATQSNLNQQPLICNNGKIYRINGVPTLRFHSKPGKKPICLKTSPYNMRFTATYWYYQAVRSEASIFIVGGAKSSSEKPTTFVSKTSANVPDPFDMYNGRSLVSATSTNLSHIEQTDMLIPIDGPKSLNIWSFTHNAFQTNWASGYFLSSSYFNSKINSAKASNLPRYDGYNYAKNSEFIIGSRQDEQTALDGWISEVWLFPYYMGPSSKSINYLDNTVRLLNTDMTRYYKIGHLSNVVDVHNTYYLNHSGLTQEQQDNLVCAYSLRKLSDGYSGPAVRIRRTSDGSQTDVFFDSQLSVSSSSTAVLKNQSVTTMGEFCKSTSCYVTRWYNQGGRDSLYLFQKNENYQPLIYENDNLITLNGKPTIYFDSTQHGPNHLKTKNFVGFPPVQYTGHWNRPLVRFDSYVVGGVKENTAFNTFFSKTNNAIKQTLPVVYKNLPAPFDMYNDKFSIGSGHISYWRWDCITQATLKNSIEADVGFNTWHFFSNPVNNFLNAADYYAGPYSNLNYSNNSEITLPTSKTNMNDYPISSDAGMPLMIGTRLDSLTSLNGWISELFFFNNSPSERPGRYNNLTTNMLGYYNIGKSGNCLDFDPAQNNYVQIGSKEGLYNTKSSYTKEAWVYWTGEDGNRQIISSQDIFILSDGKLFAENNRLNNINSGYVKAKEPIPANAWTHVAVTYDSVSNLFLLYVNGKPVEFTINGTPRASLASQTYLGKHPSSNRYYFDGKMDEVRIWNIARSSTDIQNNYNSIINSGSGLVAYYNFDQGSPGADNSSTTTLINNVLPIQSDHNGALAGFNLNGIVSNWVKSGVPIK